MTATEIGPVYVLAGALAYLLLPLSDLASQRGKPNLKRGIFTTSSAILAVSLFQIIRQSAGWTVPGFLRGVGVVLALGFLALMLYSLFVEVRLRGGGLVTTGTYALVRHPGVLWWLLFLCSILLASGAKLLLVAIPVWVTLDLLYVAVQERLFFDRLFGEAYGSYRSQVPMIVPTPASTRRFIATLFDRTKT